jgi:hypothetical protein
MDILKQTETLTADRQLPPAAEAALATLAIEHVDEALEAEQRDHEKALATHQADLARIDAEALEANRAYEVMVLEDTGQLRNITHYTQDRPRTSSK